MSILNRPRPANRISMYIGSVKNITSEFNTTLYRIIDGLRGYAAYSQLNSNDAEKPHVNEVVDVDENYSLCMFLENIIYDVYKDGKYKITELKDSIFKHIYIKRIMLHKNDLDESQFAFELIYDKEILKEIYQTNMISVADIEDIDSYIIKLIQEELQDTMVASVIQQLALNKDIPLITLDNNPIVGTTSSVLLVSIPIENFNIITKEEVLDMFSQQSNHNNMNAISFDSQSPLNNPNSTTDGMNFFGGNDNSIKGFGNQSGNQGSSGDKESVKADIARLYNQIHNVHRELDGMVNILKNLENRL